MASFLFQETSLLVGLLYRKFIRHYYFLPILSETYISPIVFNCYFYSIGKDFKDDLQFLLEGVSEFDVQGGAIASEVMVHGPLAFPIAVTPAEKAFIAGAYYGQGRVILVSHEGYMGRDSLSTFLINAIKWLDEGRKGVIGILPSLNAAHTVLSKSGLDCQLTGFREDLSVYVCTSYSDAQCAEIQEFVAEGGGLMIGGHAWYWAQTHCGCNEMTDYPGNRILNKMGLCLLGSTLGGGLYKAPEVDHCCKEGYHFRSMLHRFAEHANLGQELNKQEQSCLKQLGNDCASYLRMRSHDSAAYNSMVALLSDIVKKVGVPQVCSNCPVQSAKDYLMLHVGSEVYKVSPDPDALLPYIIKDKPNLPTVSNARVRISANTGGTKVFPPNIISCLSFKILEHCKIRMQLLVSACDEWISTGLYLSPGMKTYIAVPPEIAGKNWQVMNQAYTCIQSRNSCCI